MLIETEHLRPGGRYGADIILPHLQNHAAYCGLDCCLTLEILDELERLFPEASPIYDFERALQAPYLEIMQRGFLVDDLSRRAAAQDLGQRIDMLWATLTEFATAVWHKPLNPRSPKQLQEFFYGALGMPEIWLNIKGERKLSTNREAMEKLHDYLYARPFVNCILAIRDLSKQLEVFETEIDPDKRFRAGYNIAGTETGRPSSSANAFGTASNAQNISPALRYVFIADPGCKLCVIDLEQVEARDVGFFCGCLFGDWAFLNACESGDLHTNNAKLIWPHLGWTGDAKKDRTIADRLFYRDFTFRDMTKRGGHASHYYAKAATAARFLKLPEPIMTEFQIRYIRGGRLNGIEIEPAYPCIAKWWEWTAIQLQLHGHLTTPFGRQRHFFGRPGDDTTLREAIAYLPQSTTADRMNLGLWRVWKAMPQVQLLAQTYDSITFQYREDADEAEIIGEALSLIRVELKGPNGRSYIVPGEAKVGYNWGAQVTPEDVARALAQGKKPPRLNPLGLSKWKPGQIDARRRPGIMQRSLT